MKNMPTPLLLLALFFLLTPTRAQLSGPMEYKSLGIRFTIPTGWVGQETEEGMVMGSNTEAGLILLLQHTYNSLEQIKQEADQGIIEEGIQLRRSGEYRAEGSKGIGAEFSGIIQGENAKAYVIAVLNPSGGGVSVMAMTTAAVYSEQLVSRAQSLASSVAFFEPVISAEIKEWKAFLSDVRLTYMDSYSSSGISDYEGYSSYGGYSTETVISLCKAGYFSLSSQSSTSVDTGGAFANSNGSNQGAGTWKVIGDAQGKPLLQLNGHDGTTYEYKLSYEDGKTYLNGSRYFRTLPGDPNGYAPDCP